MTDGLEGHRARKRFGQNFLTDAHWIGRIAEAIAPEPGQTIIEIGPGRAALTRELIARAGRITAVEIDRDLAAWLRGTWGEDELRLIEADALALDWRGVLAGCDRPVRIVGNLPYNISSPLLFALAQAADLVADQHFMLQREVVERMASPAGSKTYGRLSVMLQHRYRIRKLFDVPPGAFDPVPKVVSSVVRMIPLAASEMDEVDETVFADVVRRAFGQRRKTLRNALAGMLDEKAISAAGIDPSLRAEAIGVEGFTALARAAGG